MNARSHIRERPILFSGAMVRAILEGRKTQTRRMVKLPSSFKPDPAHRGQDGPAILATVPWYAQPGDRLWVRETYAKARGGFIYRADGTHTLARPWTPAIHMPRRACRIVLEVTGVRVERLQDISEDDARAEGCEAIGSGGYGPITFVNGYRALWDSLNAARGSGWAANPWVWVIEFKRVDTLKAVA